MIRKPATPNLFRPAPGVDQTVLRAQTRLTTKYADETLTRCTGFPIRLRAATKPGFKTPKQIIAMEVTKQNSGGYWEDRRFNWFSGI